MAKKAKSKKGGKKGKKKKIVRRKPARRKAPARKKAAKRAAKTVSRAAPSPKAGGVKIGGKMRPRFDEILTPAALQFIAALHRKFDGTRKQLLARRADRQHRFDAGELPDFLLETRHIRDQGWKVAPLPRDLL